MSSEISHFKSLPSYTCLMSVYEKESPANLKVSIDSILSQTILPDEFIIVKDGLLPHSLETVLEQYKNDYPWLFRYIEFEENRGLWRALRSGVEEASCEYIMRMDSDDYSIPERAEIQLGVLVENPVLDCVGSLVIEFEDNSNLPCSEVVLPESHSDIVKFSQSRCPYRHPTLIYRKSAVIKAGNYQAMPFFEDYDLALRLIDSGATLFNVQKDLVWMRVNDSFYERRGSREYFSKMVHFRINALKSGYITKGKFAKALIPHGIVTLLPNTLRRFIYVRFLRKKTSVDIDDISIAACLTR